MSAMGWFMNDAWNRFGGGVLATIAVLYAAVFLIMGRRLWYGLGLKVPGGLLFTLAVWMTPLLLCLLGGLIMAAGIYYHKHALTIETALMRVIPPWIQRLLPPQRT